MWIQCASNRIAWVIPEVMNNELIHVVEQWPLGRRSTVSLSLTLVYSSSGCVCGHKRCCRSSIAGTATATRELARDQNGVLIAFPESSVNALDAHSIRIDSERFLIGVNAH